MQSKDFFPDVVTFPNLISCLPRISYVIERRLEFKRRVNDWIKASNITVVSIEDNQDHVRIWYRHKPIPLEEIKVVSNKPF